ncbi:DUF948 domain-containing protein [Sporosarcina sp. Te-1]|uniref:DUF948 domain-containing protein n=1 Tax=Sporosarcina sp. Te-1 TaxID=2818390 RepID=UPI001A9EA344|nr:DUF948 domain-containing protein [Sporosarcina sp. Te-1]QTD41922.1 DUF948 domain-containing protein [Sporosarcina sp. Te-1]
MLVHIGVFLIAISFAVVSIYIAKMLLRTSRVLATAGQSVALMEARVDQMIGEMEETLYVAGNTVNDLDRKLDSMSSAFYVVRDIGDTSETLTDGISDVVKTYEQADTLKGTGPFVRLIQFSEFAVELFKSWKQGERATKTYQGGEGSL